MRALKLQVRELAGGAWPGPAGRFTRVIRAVGPGGEAPEVLRRTSRGSARARGGGRRRRGREGDLRRGSSGGVKREVKRRMGGAFF